MMPLHLRLLFLFVFLLLPLSSAQHYGSLWCHQGSNQYSPAQCEPSTVDCFKFVCDHGETGFVARGCGVTVSRTASGLPKESCNQALAHCQAIGGNGSCHTCSDLHMCNKSGLPTFPPLVFIACLLRFL